MENKVIDKYPTYGEIDNASFDQLAEWIHNLRKPVRPNYYSVKYIEAIKYEFIEELYLKRSRKVHNW
jgi:hypothetical protein